MDQQEQNVLHYLFGMLHLLCYYDILTIHSLLYMINRVLFYSLSTVNIEISKNYSDIAVE